MFDHKYRNELFEFLAFRDRIDCLSKTQLLRIFARQEELLILFKNEVYVNLDNAKEEGLGYLEKILDQLEDFFPEPLTESDTYNLILYHENYRRYRVRYDVLDYNLIHDYISGVLDLDPESLAGENFESLLKSDRLRRFDLPGRSLNEKHLREELNSMRAKGLLSDILFALDVFDSPDEIPEENISHIETLNSYKRIILYSMHMAWTEFLWLLLGLVLSEIKRVQSSSEMLVDLFKDKGDLQRILTLLRGKLIINTQNVWQGYYTHDGDFVPAKTSALGLIDVLIQKGYLKSPQRFTNSKVFNRELSLNLSVSALKHSPRNLSEHILYFESVIPDRDKL